MTKYIEAAKRTMDFSQAGSAMLRDFGFLNQLQVYKYVHKCLNVLPIILDNSFIIIDILHNLSIFENLFA